MFCPRSARSVSDEARKPEILRGHASNCDGVYGTKKSCLTKSEWYAG
jgi:hypothetical protein